MRAAKPISLRSSVLQRTSRRWAITVALAAIPFGATRAQQSLPSLRLGPSTNDIARLRSIVATDKSTACLVRSARQRVRSVSGRGPNPLRHIETEGRLESDPVRVRSETALHDMDQLRDLWFLTVAVGERSSIPALVRILAAWQQSYQPSGNPIDETYLVPAVFAFDLARASGTNADTLSRLASWLHSIAEAEIEHRGERAGTRYSNWDSHRVEIVGLIGLALDDSKLIGTARTMFEDQLTHGLRGDGSSIDFEQRDALDYHRFTLEPLLGYAMAAEGRVGDLYHHVAANGASLDKSVDFLLPYARGTRTHAEWVNSRVRIDSVRARAGIAKYKPGSLFAPGDARWTLERAAFFDSTLAPLATSLYTKGCAVYPSVQLLLDRAHRRRAND